MDATIFMRDVNSKKTYTPDMRLDKVVYTMSQSHLYQKKPLKFKFKKVTCYHDLVKFSFGKATKIVFENNTEIVAEAFIFKTPFEIDGVKNVSAIIKTNLLYCFDEQMKFICSLNNKDVLSAK